MFFALGSVQRSSGSTLGTTHACTSPRPDRPLFSTTPLSSTSRPDAPPCLRSSLAPPPLADPPLVSVRVTRAASLPDRVRLARYRHAPELGTRILFFSGGTGLRGLSQKLVAYTHHSRHIITPFDSGGSSAKLRRSFRMPAVGDLRNRLMALADTSVLGNPEIYRLFAYRFPEEGDQTELRRDLDRIARGRDERVTAIPDPLRSIVRRHVGFFRDAMPASFDLRGANVGNLVLAGGYLNQGRKLESVLYLFSRLVEVRGVVRPVVERDLHLVAQLADGRTVVGQHQLTGKNCTALDSPIERLYLSRSRTRIEEYRPEIGETVDGLIRSADLICYPVGSFYTSLIATLLPAGVADAVAAADVPKVYVPNPSDDPEEIGMGLVEKVATLQRYLREGVSKRTPADRLLQFVLVDGKKAGVKKKTMRAVERLGVRVIDVPLMSPTSGAYLDDERLAQALLSLA
jgi:CofD-related protein of GAK system